MAMRYTFTAIGVSALATLPVALTAAGAQEAAPRAACGTVVRRDMLRPATATDSMMRARALIELERVAEVQHAATVAASAPSGAAAGAVAAGGMGAAAVAGGGRVRLLGTRGWLGVQASELSETRLTGEGRVVRYCDYPVVVSIEPGSPAARAGLESGDTIVAYNGADLRAAGEIALDRLLVPDDTLRVGLRRSGRPLIVPVVVGRAPGGGTLQGLASNGPGFSYVIINNNGGDLPGPAIAPVAPPSAAAVRMGRARVSARAPEPLTTTTVRSGFIAGQPLLFSFGLGGAAALAGAQVVAMDDDLGAVVGARSGVLVIRIGEGTPAAAAGLRSGDVIVSADGQSVTTPSVLQRMLLRAEDERVVALRVSRQGKTRDVSLRW